MTEVVRNDSPNSHPNTINQRRPQEMSEYQRGYNAGLVAIIKTIYAAITSGRHPNIESHVKKLLTADEPPPTTYEAGKQAAFQDFVSASVSQP